MQYFHCLFYRFHFKRR